MFHVNYLGARPQFTGSRKNVKEFYAVQACEKAAAALARRKEMMTNRFMKVRIQGEGVKVKGLPSAGNAAI